jgi:hypothetical protein
MADGLWKTSGLLYRFNSSLYITLQWKEICESDILKGDFECLSLLLEVAQER